MSEQSNKLKKTDDYNKVVKDNQNKSNDPSISQKKQENEQEEKPYQSVRNYLEECNVIKILQEGLLEVEKTRPSDPVYALGEYLINHSKTKTG